MLFLRWVFRALLVLAGEIADVMTLVDRVADYCLNDTRFNDFQYHYPYLPYHAGAAGKEQEIIRNVWITLFKKGVLRAGF